MFGKVIYERVPCAHCGGTGKCSCGGKALRGLKVHTDSDNISIKQILGVDCLCLGVCDSCKGRGYHSFLKEK